MNKVNLNLFEQGFLFPKKDYDHTFRVLTPRYQKGEFYTFDNGKLISSEKENSYRSAFRKHILPKLFHSLCLGETSVVVDLNTGFLRTTEVTDESIQKYYSEFFYSSIVDHYVNPQECLEVHSLIDNWNQRKNRSIDSIKINPHDIQISSTTAYTFQQLSDLEDPDQKYYFINGIPVECYSYTERVIDNQTGLVNGYYVLDQEIDPFEVMSLSLLNNSSYTILASKTEGEEYIRRKVLK